MFCSKCGAQVSDGAVYCSKCGVQVVAAVDPNASPNSRLATALLACPWLVVGLFGAHRFYMGKIGTAVIMLLLGIAPIVCVIGMFVVAAVYVEQEDAPVLFWVFYGLAYVFGFAVGIWALVDFIIAVTGNSKDSQGRVIKKW